MSKRFDYLLGIGQKLLRGRRGGGTVYVGRVVVFLNKFLGGLLFFTYKIRPSKKKLG